MNPSGLDASGPVQPDLTDWRQTITHVWIRIWIALNKAGALAILICIHKGLDLAAAWLVPPGWEKVLAVYRITFFAVFSVIYLHFLWEMLIVFVPQLRAARRPKKVASAAVETSGI